MRVLLLLLLGLTGSVSAQIPKPGDAQKPLSPEETVASYQVPEGYVLDLVAAEPFVQSPTGICWTADGGLYVCELHGYNLEGQLEIEELNKTGVLDTEVRRIQAGEAYKQAALEGTYGVVKRLFDDDGDHRVDRAQVLADDLPPAYGMVPHRLGVIVACAPDILYLADRDGDGVAEVRETLFTGFGLGPLERGINNPQWDPDGWIIFGAGAGGGTITGPHLAEPVLLPGGNFRIRPDGTAIEPVVGNTHTFGFTKTPEGDTFVVSTGALAIQVAPIEARYLARNPEMPASGLQRDISAERRAFPRSQPHPWRVKRQDHPEYFEYYRSRYGAGDSDAGGWFTSGCSPLWFRGHDSDMRGFYFACDPAQNLVFAGDLSRPDPNTPVHRLERFRHLPQREWLASTDAWSHPMALSEGPDGALWIVDFYREIIEDYSAIPRHLQQQYGLYAGHDRGRIYRLRSIRQSPSPIGWDARELALKQLGARVFQEGISRRWFLETAQRLFREQDLRHMADALLQAKGFPPYDGERLKLALLEDWNALNRDFVRGLLDHPDGGIRRQATRFWEQYGETDSVDYVEVLRRRWEQETDPAARIQIALSLGESDREDAVASLTTIGQTCGSMPWMDLAIVSGLRGRELTVGAAWMRELMDAEAPLKLLSEVIFSRADPRELLSWVILAAATPETAGDAALSGASRLENRRLDLESWDEAAWATVASWGESPREALRDTARRLFDARSQTAPAEVTTPLGALAAQDPEDETIAPFLLELKAKGDVDHGSTLFDQHCALCHAFKGRGVEVGPDIRGELAQGPEALARHILQPNARVRPGFETVTVHTQDGALHQGILKDDGVTTVTLALPGGGTRSLLRTQIKTQSLDNRSMMPNSYASVFTKEDLRDLIAWLLAPED